MTDEQTIIPAEETAAVEASEVEQAVEAGQSKRKLSAMSAEERAAKHAKWLAKRRERAEDLVEQSRRSWAAIQGWDKVTTPEQWRAMQEQAAEDWLSGATLVEMCGGERYLDPPRMALLLHLWHHFVNAYRPEGPAEYLCIAMALVAYNQLMRTTEVVGNLAARLEHQFFDLTSPIQVRVIEKDGRAGAGHGDTPTRLTGQETVEALGRDLLPLLDRLNRMVIRNLKLLRDLKTTPINMTVQNYGQLNVGQQQANVAQPGQPTNVSHERPVQPAHGRRCKCKVCKTGGDSCL